MKRILSLLTLLIMLVYPLTGYGQFEFFEHRYKYELKDVLDASKFEKKEGYWEGYKDGKLVGYVMLSKDWTPNLLGYSGKHLETLIGMDQNGILTGTKIIFHSEPIVLIGLKENDYLKFIEQYPGKSIRQKVAVGKEIYMDAITGATVTAVVHNAIIMRSAREVALRAGILEYKEVKAKKISTAFSKLSWKELLESDSIKNIVVSAMDMGEKGKDAYIDLYFGVANAPSIGMNILGDRAYKDLVGNLKSGETAIFIFSKGEGSFKGSGFARGGIFDRFNLEQEDRVYLFRDKDYRILTEIKAEGAPEMKEGGLFIVREKDFDPSRTFRFNLVMSYRTEAKKEFKTYKKEYIIPDRFLE